MTSNLEARDVLEAIERTGDSRYGFYWSDLAWGDSEIGDHLEVNGVDYPFEVVASKTGSEGDWQTDTFIVVKVGEQYFRKNGYYASHDGTYWDGTFEETRPTEKTVTVWE